MELINKIKCYFGKHNFTRWRHALVREQINVGSIEIVTTKFIRKCKNCEKIEKKFGTTIKGW